MTQEELQKLLAQSYGNVIKAGEALTANAAPIPTANVITPSSAIGQATKLANAATTGPNYFASGVGALQGANAAIGSVNAAISNAMTTAAQTTGAYDPQSYKAFMDPYQQEVIDRYTQEMQRQFNIAGQGRAAQALGAGAFGGGREGVLEAEAQRGFQQQLGTGIAGLLSSGFQSAQQQAQQAFENQRAAQQSLAGLQLAGGELGLAGGELGTNIGQLYGTFGVQAPMTQANLASTLSQLGVTETAAQQQAAQQAYQNQLAQYMQPYQQLGFQSDLLGGVSPAYLQNPATTAGNPLLAGIGALGGYAG